jgi:hypothetical protein
MQPFSPNAAPSDSSKLALQLERFMSRIGIETLLKAFGLVFGLSMLLALVGPRAHLTRAVVLSIAALLAVMAILGLAFYRKRIATTDSSKIRSLAVCALFAAALLYFVAPRPATAHPVFNTPLTMLPDARPAIQVDIIDSDSHNIFTGYYDLYLSVQSSRFTNSDTRVLFPLNVKNFQGCNSKFIQLPFEVANDDELVFELIYESGLTADEQKWVLKASKAVGYCLAVQEELYNPDHDRIVEPAYATAAAALGEGINLLFQQKFKNLAKAECIVESSRPHAPQQANKITLIEDAGSTKLARANVRLYYPSSRLD